jgi:hypothetical protein
MQIVVFAFVVLKCCSVCVVSLSLSSLPIASISSIIVYSHISRSRTAVAAVLAARQTELA